MSKPGGGFQKARQNKCDDGNEYAIVCTSGDGSFSESVTPTNPECNKEGNSIGMNGKNQYS